MKKILFYINAIHEGGAERVMVNLAGQFAEVGYETVLLTSYRDTWEYPLSDRVKRLTMEEEEIKQSRIMRNLSRILKLRKVCIEEKPDVIVSFMAEPNFRAVCATVGLPVKTIISVRNDPNKEYAGKIFRFVGKVLLPMADGCVFQTEDAKDWFSQRLKEKSRVIYNAVKKDFYECVRTPIPGRIVTCGRLNPQKNHAMLIDAFSQIAAQYPEAQLCIYGEGDLRNTLQNQIDSLGLQDRVTLMGQTSNVLDVLQHAAVFVLSSDYEGMPNALMEALAVGVPSVSTDCPCGGPRTLINCDQNGVLVPVGDAAATAQALKNLLADKEYAERIGMNAREKAQDYYPTRVFQQWHDYLVQVVDE